MNEAGRLQERIDQARALAALMEHDAAELEQAADQWEEMLTSPAELWGTGDEENEAATGAERLRVDETVSQAAPMLQCAGCLYSDEPWHDLFLSVETSAEPWLTFFAKSSYEDGWPEDLSQVAHFISTHNWHDPACMARVAEEIEVMQRGVSA